MAKYAQIEDLNGEVFRVVIETDGEVYFYDADRRWCYYNKSEEGNNYRYTPAGVRLKRRLIAELLDTKTPYAYFEENGKIK